MPKIIFLESKTSGGSIVLAEYLRTESDYHQRGYSDEQAVLF